jgi:NAD(P)-dependent dehydrogenase (short-subunit alcohol dehydrogenase family)
VEPTGVAVVTGASRGIGRAVAVALADAGFDVIATMRDPNAAATLPGETSGRLTVARLDVTDPDSFEMPRDLRVLVNNAGKDGNMLPVEHLDMTHWREIFETNFFGPAALAARAVPRLRESGGGVIANVTTSALLPPAPFMGAYRASKAALSAFGETLQAEVAQFGIRVLEILPGPIETTMLAESRSQAGAAARYPEYAELASRVGQSTEQFPETYPPPEAARRILAAILDDAGPMRRGCDDLSEQMLDLWSRTPYEAWLATIQPLLFAADAWGEQDPIGIRDILVPTPSPAPSPAADE